MSPCAHRLSSVGGLMPTIDAMSPVAAHRRAVKAFLDGGYVRTPNEDRRAEGHHLYKKGWEIRFILHSKPEVARLVRVLEDAGLTPGSAYRRSPNTWAVPVYGREQVTRFMGWMEAPRRR